MALTLNGIGQGFVADCVAALLEAEGLTDILIDTGEMRALEDRAWPVRTAGGASVPLAGRALATSAPRGTCFDADGQDGHILDPRTGAPASSAWAQVSVPAPSAALADALSTAACLTRNRGELDTLMAGFPAARLEDARPA
jgi:thiamine biosynthesis lipoprotein